MAGNLEAKSTNYETVGLIQTATKGLLRTIEDGGIDSVMEWEVDEVLNWTNTLSSARLPGAFCVSPAYFHGRGEETALTLWGILVHLAGTWASAWGQGYNANPKDVPVKRIFQ